MFGNSSSFNNIFGGITQSHQRLFGGDRALATKDIEGAQPRKYNKHVWGGYDPNPYNNGLSYDPSKSSIKSPILGDNVPAVNRAVPNSSGLVFREPGIMSQTSNARLMAGSSDRLRNQQQPASSGMAQSAVVERKQASTGNYFGQEFRDSKFGVIPNMRIPSGGEQALTERIRGNNPPSQMREQNIFSQPSYINEGTPGLKKANTPLTAEKLLQIAMVKEKMERHRLAHNYQSQKAISSARSPESYVPSVYTPSKDQLNEKNSSRRFQTEISDPQQPNLYIDQQVKALQKNPIFSQNRNFGQDNVLYSALSQQNPLRPSQNQQDVLSNIRNSRPATNSNNYQEPQKQQQAEQQAGQQQQNGEKQAPSSQLQQKPIESQGIFQLQRPNSNIQSRKLESASRNPAVPYINEKNYEEALRQSRESLRNIARSSQNNEALLSSRYSQKQQQLIENDISASKINPLLASYTKPASRGMYSSQNGEFRQMSASEMLRQRTGVRTALSSRGRMILNQEKQRQTSNAEYGIYLDYARGGGLGDFYPKEKILYQSKRDNFLRSGGIRSQSAEGSRLENTLSIKQSTGGNNNAVSPIGQLINGAQKISAIKKFEQYGVNDYDIVNNISVNPRVESPLKRRTENQPELDFGSKALLSSQQRKDEILDSQITGRKNVDSLDVELQKSKNTPNNADAFLRSGAIRSPIAGIRNEYAESNFNKQISNSSQLMLEKQQSIDGNGIKFFGGKALKNLSNVNLY